MAAPRSIPLVNAPQRVLTGFGRAMRAYSRYFAPRSVEELAALTAQAAREGMKLAFRGAGNSYGDAALNQGALVLETTGLKRFLSWDPDTGIADVEPGVTIGDLWHHTIADGWWPAVVPGTMFATMGGCAAMNIHGKNCYKVGPFGDQVLDFDLLTPEGKVLRCSRETNADVFHAAIAGCGLLGAFTRVRLKLKRIQSGLLHVNGIGNRSLEHAFELFEERLPRPECLPDYLVGWFDGFARGKALGRGVIHEAWHIPAEGDWQGPRTTLQPEYQELPPRIMGFPRAQVWRVLKLVNNDPGMRFMNALKYRLTPDHSYFQSHGAFAFLLDYVPGWRNAYDPHGLIQYQPFVPAVEARRVFRTILEMCQEAGLVPYLLVFKRHRPDPFLLTHAVDGYSLAMDFKVHDRPRLWELCHRMSEVVLDAGGRFYFAKDAVMRPSDAERMFGRERIAAFASLKRRLDPQGLLCTDQSRRVFGGALEASSSGAPVPVGAAGAR